MDSTTELSPMVTSQHPRPGGEHGRIGVIVVGAGGTGGRLIPPLMQILRRDDVVAIVDGDHVEDRNLARQNFRVRDVGENKAEVMARRYRREGIPTMAFASMLTPQSLETILRATMSARWIILGCVDNSEARRTIHAGVQHSNNIIWIDGGNEMRGGQVVLSSSLWPFKVQATRGEDTGFTHVGEFRLSGMKAMPQLLKARPEEAVEVSCRDRIDLQTVAVNQLSAACMLNILSCVLYQTPFSNCGAFFSTLNTISPIKMAKVRWDHMEILPETGFAAED